MNPEIFLQDLFGAALKAADPLHCLTAHLPRVPTTGRIVIVGAGKAAASMAVALEKVWPLDRLQGVVVTRYGYGLSTQKIKVIEAAHPVPDAAGEKAAHEILNAVQGLTAEDTVIALISGGGSALLTLPAPCLSTEEKRDINKQLLRSGAPIGAMNCVRKHLSLIKGGGLAKACGLAHLLTFIVSDIPNDTAHFVASGPTLADPTTLVDALRIIDQYQINVSPRVRAWLSDPANETIKKIKEDVRVIARAQDVLEAAARFAMENGITPVILGDAIEGEARVVAQDHVRQILTYGGPRPCVFLSGGETTVTVKGTGRGGRNAEYALAALIESAGMENLYGLACDTDGIDGSEDNAGAIFTPQSLVAAQDKNCDPQSHLENNDAYGFFSKIEALVMTGPTYTNVNDFRALLLL